MHRLLLLSFIEHQLNYYLTPLLLWMLQAQLDRAVMAATPTEPIIQALNISPADDLA